MITDTNRLITPGAIPRNDLAPLASGTPRLLFQSHGIKNGPPPKSDFLLDVRVIANPFRIPGLTAQGMNALIEWTRTHNADVINAAHAMIASGLVSMHDRRRDHIDPLSTPFVITTICAYGQHRSVAMKHILAERFTKLGYDVEVK